MDSKDVKVEDPCDQGKRRLPVKRKQGRAVFRGIEEDVTPVIEVSKKKVELTSAARDYLINQGISYEQWVADYGASKIYSIEEDTVNKWKDAYANEDLRFHWIKNRVMSYFGIKTPQTFLQLAHRSNKANYKKILRFIERPIRKKNLNKNLWFYVVRRKLNIQKMINVTWETEIIESPILKTKGGKTDSLDRSDNNSRSLVRTTKLRRKKTEKPASPKFKQYSAEIPVCYTKVISQIYMECSRRPSGRLIKVNFLGFSRIPTKKYIPSFPDVATCELQMPEYVREMRVGRISKPDERVVALQCLEQRPTVRQYDNIFNNNLGENMQKILINSYLNVDFRIQWLKEKLLIYFDMSDPREFYKMCARHDGKNRNLIMKFINSRYDPSEAESSEHVLFVYTTKYMKTYYKFVKVLVEKEELEPVVESDASEEETRRISTMSTGKSEQSIQTKSKGSLVERKKVALPRREQPKIKVKKMKIIKVKHDVALLVKYQKEVTQMHLHFGPLLTMNRSWRTNKNVLCLLRKNNPFQRIPQFDTYEEALAEMPKYILIKNFDMNGLLYNLRNTLHLCNMFMNKQISEPIFPPLLKENNGASMTLPVAVVERDSVRTSRLRTVPFAWAHLVCGPVVYQYYLLEMRGWPGTQEGNEDQSNLITDSNKTTSLDIYGPAAMRKELKNTGSAIRLPAFKYVSLKWLSLVKQMQVFNLSEKGNSKFVFERKMKAISEFDLACGKHFEYPRRMHIFTNKITKLIKLKNFPKNVEIQPEKMVTLNNEPAEDKNIEPIGRILFDEKKYSHLKREQQKKPKNYYRLPLEFFYKIKLKYVGRNKSEYQDHPFKMEIVKGERLGLPRIKSSLKSLKVYTKRLYKYTRYPNQFCIPHWREMLKQYIQTYKGLQKTTEAIFRQKEYAKKEVEFRTIFFQYLRKLYWFCREKMPRTYGPFTLYRYWKLRELMTFPFIRQCFGSRTIKFMLSHYYHNDRYYFDQFEKQFPFLIKVHKRAKYYCHMLKGFLMVLRNFRRCNSSEELCSVICQFWEYARDYWATSHFLSYQEIFTWALTYVSTTFVGKIKAIVKVDHLLSIPLIDAEKELMEILHVMILWKDEFNKFFSLCTSDSGGYNKILVLLEDDFFQNTLNVTKVCGDLLKLLKGLRQFTEVFNADLALSITEPRKVYYWRDRCIDSVRAVTNYDIFYLENDKKWDHLQMEWHKNFKKMERQSIRLLNYVFQGIRDPARAAMFVNNISRHATSKKIYKYLLRLQGNCIDKIMNEFRDRFFKYLENGNAFYDNFMRKIDTIPTGAFMSMQRYLVVLFSQLKTIVTGNKLLEAVKQDKDIGVKLTVALKEFRDFVDAIELITYVQELFIRDYVLLRHTTSKSLTMHCNDPELLLDCHVENVPTIRFNLNITRSPSFNKNYLQSSLVLGSIIKHRKTFQCLEGRALLEAYAPDKSGYVDTNPPEVVNYFARLESKKEQIRNRITVGLMSFLKGTFKTLKRYPDVNENKIKLYYDMFHFFLRTGRLSSAFIPISSLREYAFPSTVFDVSSSGMYLYLNSPHGKIDRYSIISIGKHSFEKIHKKPTYKYRKIISDDILLYNVNHNEAVSHRKNMRNSPEIIYSVIRNLNFFQLEELKSHIENTTTEMVRFHVSFFLLVLLREMFTLEDLLNAKTLFYPPVPGQLDMEVDKVLSPDEELILTTKIFMHMTEEQIKTLIEIGKEFEQIFSKENEAVKKIQSIAETEDYKGGETLSRHCVDSDTTLSMDKLSIPGEGMPTETITSTSSIATHASQNLDVWSSIKPYYYFNSYFEDIDHVPDENFGILIKISNLIVYKNNDYITLKSYLGMELTPEDLTKEFQLENISTLQDRRALPLRSTQEIEKDWDFLSNFIFEEQGDIVRHFVVKPQEIKLSLFGKNAYLDEREAHLKTNKKGEIDVYKYPIMLDKRVKDVVCTLSDRYYSEKKKIEYRPESESEEEEPEKVRRRVELVYEPVTGWGSDTSIPEDYFPQRWIDLHPRADFKPFDPYGREAAQMMLLFRKSSPVDEASRNLLESAVKKEVEPPPDSQREDMGEDTVQKTTKSLMTDKILQKEKIYEIHHNIKAKNKNIFIEPIEEKFLCYALKGSISEKLVNNLAFDGRSKKNKEIASVNKIMSKRFRNWCSNLNYYNDNKSFIPFIEKKIEWVVPYLYKKIEMSKPSSVSKIKKFRNICNIPKYRDENYREKVIRQFPRPDSYPDWAVRWPQKQDGISLHSNPTLTKIAKCRFLRRKFADPEMIKNLNSFYKYYYYKAKRKPVHREVPYDNFLKRWTIKQYYPTQKMYRKTAQNYFRKYAKLPKNSGKYIDRLFNFHSLFLLRKFAENNLLARTLCNSLNKLKEGEKKKKDKFLFGIYNNLAFNQLIEKLNRNLKSLDNTSADLFSPICSQVQRRIQYSLKAPGYIPFYIPTKYLQHFYKCISRQETQPPLKLKNVDTTQSSECLDEDISDQPSIKYEEELKQVHYPDLKTKFKADDHFCAFDRTMNKPVQEAYKLWKSRVGERERNCYKQTLADLHRRMHEILGNTNYHKRCKFYLKLPSKFIEPFSQNRNMSSTVVCTDEDYRWKFDMYFAAQTWRSLNNTIKSYNAFQDKLANENDEDLYFMRSFLKQMDIRIIVVLRSFLLYKRIPTRSKAFIENGSKLYDSRIRSIKEVLNNVINPSWMYAKKCLWFKGLNYDKPFMDFFNSVINMREVVQSNLIYINRLFYHYFKVLHYVFHGDWPPGFVNNFRFYKYFERYDAERVEYSVKNLGTNVNLFKELLLDKTDESAINDCCKGIQDKTIKNSSKLQLNIGRGTDDKFNWTKGETNSEDQYCLGHPVLTLQYSYGDIRFEEPVERLLFQLWFNYINRFTQFSRWMSGTCEYPNVIYIISQKKCFRSSMFDEFMKYTESKHFLTEGIECIIDFLNSLNSYRHKWKEFYNLWSAKRRYKIKYSIIHEDLSLAKIDEVLRYITETIKLLSGISIVSFGFVKIDLRDLIISKLVPRCKKLKSAICYGVMKRIKVYYRTFSSSIDRLLKKGDDFQSYLKMVDNGPIAKRLVSDFNVGVCYAKEAIEVLTHSGLQFTSRFLQYISAMQASLLAARSQLKYSNIENHYYQVNFKTFMTKFNSKCSKFATKWWNEGPINYAHDLETCLHMIAWYRKAFRDLRVKQKFYDSIRKKLDVYVDGNYYFEHAFINYRNVEILCAYYQVYETLYRDWNSQFWEDFNYSDIYIELEPLECSFKSLDYAVKNSEIGLEIASLISHVSETVRILRLLKDKVIKDRHWNALKHHTKYDIHVKDPDLKLNAFFEWKLWNYSEYVDELYITAKNEHDIIQKVKKLGFASVSLKYEILPYYDDGKLIGFILDSNRTVLRKLNKYIKEFKTLMDSVYATIFLESLNTWSEILAFVLEVTRDWLKVQKKWIFLKPLSLSGDLEDELPDVAVTYAPIDKDYLKMTSVFTRQRGVITQCIKRGIVKKFYKYSDTLDECLTILLNHLVTKQYTCPAFDLISIDNLQSVISC